jgi:chemotaxis protein MotB
VSLLIEKYSFDPVLISAAGYAEYRPISSNETAQGRAANRRVDLVVVGKPTEKEKLARSVETPAGAE